MINKIYRYRGLIIGSVRREFEAKYKNSLLGASWTVIQPLSMIIVYTIIFSHLMKAKLPNIDSQFSYSIYLCAGILTWNLFSEICLKSVNIFIDNSNLIKKINFPKFCLPVTLTTTALINFMIILSIFTIFLIISDSFPGTPFLSVIPITLVLTILALGIGISLGVINVFFRDVGQLFTIFLQFWFWLTPIIYPISILPEKIKSLIALNPMMHIISAYQQVFVFQKNPDWWSLLYPTIAGILSCLAGIKIYRRHHGEMVDEL